MPKATTTNLPELNLKGMRIWLSGSVPESDRPNPDTELPFEVWYGSSLEQGILAFVQEFASLVLKYGGQIIHGCHPTLTPILLEQSRLFYTRDNEKPLRLAVSNHFQTDQRLLDWQRWERDSIVDIVPGTGAGDTNRDPSLAILRSHMAEHCNAFVAIGGLWWHDVPGRAGIPKEFERAKEANVPCFILGGFGGASATYISENPDWNMGLNNGLSASQNLEIATNTNFNLVAGRLASHLHLLNERGSGASETMMAN